MIHIIDKIFNNIESQYRERKVSVNVMFDNMIIKFYAINKK